MNGEAAALQLRDPEKYKATVYEYVAKYATAAKSEGSTGTTEDEDDDEAMSELSDLSDANFDDDDELLMEMDD